MIYGKLPVAFLSAAASEKQGSINSVIAGRILGNLTQMRDLGIREMAEACHVSTASLSRFCKEIGLSDFGELKELLAKNQLWFQRQGDIAACARSAAESIDMAARSVDEKALKELCAEIQRYERVAAFGLLKAGAAALSLQSDLLMQGKQIYTHVSFPQQVKYLETADQRDLILIFSYTGSYFESIERPPDRGARIWLITGQERNFPKCVSRVLRFDSRHDQAGHPYQLLFVSGLIAQEYARLEMNSSTSPLS